MREDDETYFTPIDQFHVVVSFPWVAHELALNGKNDISSLVLSFRLECLEPQDCMPQTGPSHSSNAGTGISPYLITIAPIPF